MVLKRFYDFIFLIDNGIHILTEEEMKRWNEALAKDKETVQYIIERLCILRGEYMPKVNYTNQRIRFFEDSQPVE
jgi:hypothetical protein